MVTVNPVNRPKMFVVQPAEASWFGYNWQNRGKLLEVGYSYSSDNNSEWLDLDGIRKFIAPFDDQYLQGKLEG